MSRTAVTEKGGETRRRLVEAAAEAFMTRGYSAVSMNDLLAAAELTKGGFYFHFASKTDVAVEVVKMRQEHLQAQALAAASQHERAADQIVAMVRALVAAVAGPEKYPNMAGLERLCSDLRAEGVDDPAVVQPHEPWIETTTELFRRAQAEGDMDADTDPEQAALFAVAAFSGLEELARTGPAAAGVLGMAVDDYLDYVSQAVGLRLPLE